MRVISLVLLIGVFLGTPLWLLSSLVMPQLNSMQHTYSHLDEIVARAVDE